MKGDEFGFSPDIGRYVTRGDKTYSEWGYVYGPDELFRSSMPYAYAPDSHENYADWTDEQRAARVAENVRINEEQKKQRDAELKSRRILVARAREKLTEEEFQAILDEARDDDA